MGYPVHVRSPMARSRSVPWSLLGSLLLGSACGPFITEVESDDEDEGTDEERDTSTGGSSGTTTAGTTAATSTTTTTTTATTTTTGREPGFCAYSCLEVEDCTFGGPTVDWSCTDGFCEYVGVIPECDPATCDAIGIGSCTTVDGSSLCVTWCIDDSQCLPGFTECVGIDDAGNPYCAAIPCLGAGEGEACIIDGFGQLGVCIDGLCTCTDDSQCTGEGYACNL
jgi:hypothetical protein